VNARRKILVAGCVLLALVVGGSGAAFVATSSNASNTISGAGDWVAPTMADLAIVPSTSGAPTGATGFVKSAGTYLVYANVTDSNSGVGTVTANVANVSSAGTPTAVPLNVCASNCTVNGVTYNRVGAQQTAKTLTNGANLSFSVTATDNASNTATNGGGSVTVDNTNPTIVAPIVENAAGAKATFVKKATTYWVLTNASDAGSGVRSVTSDVHDLTGNAGDTAVALTSCASSGAPSCTVSSVTYAYAVQVATGASLADGNKTLTATANDGVGNSATSGSSSVTADSTAPTITPLIERADGASTTAIKKATTYWVLTNATDSGSGLDNTTVKTDIHNLTGVGGDTAVALVSCGSSGAPSCTVSGTTYTFAKQFSTKSNLADGSVSYSVSANDNLANAGTQAASVTADSTPPPDITDFAAIKDTAGGSPNWIGKPQSFNAGKFRVYANPPADTGSGLATVTADVHNLTGNTGDTAVALTTAGCPCAVPNNTGKTYSYRSAQLTASSSLVNAASLSYSVVSADNAVNSSTAASANVTVDNTQPVTPTSGAISTTNAGGAPGAGKAETNDTISFKFTELNMDPFLILAGWNGASSTNVTVRLTDKGGASQNDGLTVLNTNLGSVDMGNSGYVAADVDFTNSAMTISTAAGIATVTITLGTPSGSTAQVTGTPTATWTPSATATDKAGNTVPTTNRTMTVPMF
jgi:large repetitive protein